MSTQEHHVWSLIVHENGVRRVVALDRLPFRIGNGSRADEQLKGEGVDRLHAIIEAHGESLRIVDMGSRGGTFVDGTRVSVADLRPGQQARLGNVTLEVQRRSKVEESAPVQPPRNAVRELSRYERRYLSRPARTDGTVEVAMFVGDYLMHEALYGESRDVTIGSGDAEIGVGADELPVDHAFTLVHWSAGRPFLRLPGGCDALLYVGVERIDLPDASEADGRPIVVPLTGDTRARVRFGKQTILVHQTVRPSIWKGRWTANLAPALMVALALAAVLHAMAGLIVAFWPAEQQPIGLSSFESDETFAAIFLEEPEPEPEPEPDPVVNPDDQTDEAPAGGGETGGATGGSPNGPVGGSDLSAPSNQSHGSPGGTVAEVDVSGLGILAILSEQEGAAFGQAATGNQALAAMHAVGPMATNHASSGLAGYYTGSGINSVGGEAQTAGPLDFGDGSGPAGLDEALTGIGDGGYTEVAVATNEHEATISTSGAVESGMTRDQIQRVVREHRREVRACYEDNLRLDRGLAGRIVVEWMISPDGAVAGSRVTTSTLGSEAVEACISRRVLQWRFPAVRGGGTVRVSYPFDFAPVGS